MSQHSDTVLSGGRGDAVADVALSTSQRPSVRRWLGLILALKVRCILNPRLAIDLLRLIWAFRARNWLRKPPFLPLPPSEYIRWRMYTAYGDENAIPPIEDVIRFARWRRKVMHL